MLRLRYRVRKRYRAFQQRIIRQMHPLIQFIREFLTDLLTRSGACEVVLFPWIGVKVV